MDLESSNQDLLFRLSEGHMYAPCLPTLPEGFIAQPLTSFSDGSGLLLYEFNRVYRPIDCVIDREHTTLGQLDEELSFWSVLWCRLHESGDELPAGRSISYGLARRLKPSRLTFEQFSQLRDEVPALLHVQDILRAPSDRGSRKFRPEATQGDAWTAKQERQLNGGGAHFMPRRAVDLQRGEDAAADLR